MRAESFTACSLLRSSASNSSTSLGDSCSHCSWLCWTAGELFPCCSRVAATWVSLEWVRFVSSHEALFSMESLSCLTTWASIVDWKSLEFLRSRLSSSSSAAQRGRSSPRELKLNCSISSGVRTSLETICCASSFSRLSLRETIFASWEA